MENTGTGYEQAMYQEMFDTEMKWFVQECIGKGRRPLSTMEDAEEVCRLHGLVMESIRAVSYTHLFRIYNIPSEQHPCWAFNSLQSRKC